MAPWIHLLSIRSGNIIFALTEITPDITKADSSEESTNTKIDKERCSRKGKISIKDAQDPITRAGLMFRRFGNTKINSHNFCLEIL